MKTLLAEIKIHNNATDGIGYVASVGRNFSPCDDEGLSRPAEWEFSSRADHIGSAHAAITNGKIALATLAISRGFDEIEFSDYVGIAGVQCVTVWVKK